MRDEEVSHTLKRQFWRSPHAAPAGGATLALPSESETPCHAGVAPLLDEAGLRGLAPTLCGFGDRARAYSRQPFEPMRILIVEDEPKTVAYLRKGLTEQGFVTDFASNGSDGLALAETGGYDAVVLDGMLPRLDGLEVLEQLRRRRNTPVIMLTARDTVEDRLRGLGAGADDYLVKPFSFLELLARLQAIMRRGRNESTLLSVGDLQVDLIARRATRAGRRLNLTAKEFSLLSVLARRQSQIVSKTAIAELVWDIHFDTNTNVIEVVVKRLRAKLDLPDQPRLLHTVRGMGYVLEPRPSEAAA